MDGETTLLLAPVLVVAVVVLLGFVGCYNGLDEGDQTDTTDFPEKLPYVKHVLDDGPVAYWRLVDTLLDTEPAQANDEIVVPPGPHHGSLNSLGTNLTLAAWPSFLLGDNSKSMYFDGGYVAVEVAGQPELSPGA